MTEITLAPMTRELFHALYRGFENDPDIYMNMQYYTQYAYNQEKVDGRFDSLQTPERVVFAVMLDGAPIGEVQLKRINRERNDCTLSIHLQNDAVKNRGFGTQAEKQAVRYAFDVLKLDREFFSTHMSNDRGKKIIMHTISMSKDVGLGLIAEGVETADQAQLLENCGCDTAQGYLYAKPMRVQEAEKYLKNTLQSKTDNEGVTP